ncbi:MAG: DUF2852 domain-containing protein [Hyphomicrobiales bacterium]|nr:DUF2852 domain-containing protein [Hyphomicrobiales bacterium]
MSFFKQQVGQPQGGVVGAGDAANWKPLEVAAMVAGFIVYWPLGLAVIGAKLWQRRAGHQGHLFAFAQEKADTFQNKFDQTAREWTPSNWKGGFASPFAGFQMRSATGNAAFDAWRAQELARLEEEHRKLAEAEREFNDYAEKLRRARDQEEFEKFMQDRKGK